MAEITMPEKAIGHVDTMSEEELAGKHVDAVTGFVYATDEDYIEATNRGEKPSEEVAPAEEEEDEVVSPIQREFLKDFEAYKEGDIVNQSALFNEGYDIPALVADGTLSEVLVQE